MLYTEHFSTRQTPQTLPIPGTKQIPNAGGGYAYEIDSWQRLRRFLILGSEGGTYYVKEAKLTKENAENVIKCIQQDGRRAVEEIVNISVEGRASKNDPAIFALALCCTFGNPETKRYAYANIDKVCRIGTHIFTFCQMIKDLRGWSRGLRRGVAQYYKNNESLEYQLVKYRQRNGWTHRDVLRLCHANGDQNLLKWAVGKPADLSVHPIIQAYETVSKLEKPTKEGIELIKHLPWEALPTSWLKDKKVWEALLPKLPPTALMRNLNKLAAYAGVDSNLSEHAQFVASRFSEEAIAKARLHPLKILEALKVYSQGRGIKGDLTWRPAPCIQEALEAAFYHSFRYVEPTGKSFMIGLDVSSSMEAVMTGSSVLSSAEAAAALCMLIARTEKKYGFIAFANEVRTLNITASMSLPEVLRQTTRQNFGSTDCSLPMRYATDRRLEVDCFQVLTDNETNTGFIHPSQALKAHRQMSGINSKLVVWGMTATRCSIADPNDSGMLDVAGFDTAAPEIIRQFILE